MEAHDRAAVQRRALLVSLLDRVRRGLELADLVGSSVETADAVRRLGPLAGAQSVVDWIAVNGERVDAIVTDGERQWRVVFGAATEDVIDWLDVYERPVHFAGIEGGRAVVINGPSGAGKSTLLRAIQRIATVPFVVLDEPEHVGNVQPAYLIWRDRAPALHRGYLEAIAALARSGNHVGVSAAGHHQRELLDALRDVPTLHVGLRCDLGVLNLRERRSGRWGGIAAASLHVHDGWTYDVEFDTTSGQDPEGMAKEVLDRL